MRGHPGRAAAQHRVGARGTITGDHMKWRVASAAGLEFEQNVEDARIDAMHLPGAKVAQEMVHPGELARRIATPVVDAVESLSRMSMDERERPACRRACPGRDGCHSERYRAGAAEKCSTACREALGS